MFPFKYKGITYNCCTRDILLEETGAVCSTKVDDSGQHVEGQGNYGICEQKCQPKTYYENNKHFYIRPKPDPGILEQLLPDIDTDWYLGSSFNTGSSIKTLPFWDHKILQMIILLISMMANVF